MPNEQLNTILFEIDQELQQRGQPPMSDEVLRETYKAVSHPEFQQAWATGQWTPQRIVDEVLAAHEAMQGGGAPPMGNGMGPGSAPAMGGGMMAPPMGGGAGAQLQRMPMMPSQLRGRRGAPA